MAGLHLTRIVLLALTLLFAPIVLGLSAHAINFSTEFFGIYFYFSALGVATAVLTILTLPFMLIVDFTRKGAFTSKVWVELLWLGILWVLWLATGADAASTGLFVGSCDYIETEINTACHEYYAIIAFSFLAWIALFGYWVTLLIFAIIGSSRGHNTWFSTVRDGTFLGPTDGAAAAPASAPAPAPETAYAQPQPQPVYTPQPGLQPQYTGVSNAQTYSSGYPPQSGAPTQGSYAQV